MAGKLIRSRPCAAALAVAAFLYAAGATWIPVKAAVGQALLDRAWSDVLTGNPHARPWPWADTSPVALLEVPRLGVRQLVLDGTSGRNLAWGPTAMTSTAGNDVLVSAHRDTHFEALENIGIGDRIRLTTTGGERLYAVADLNVVDSRERELVIDETAERLTLVTCWPFDAINAGGPMRLVVTALPVTGDREQAAFPP